MNNYHKMLLFIFFASNIHAHECAYAWEKTDFMICAPNDMRALEDRGLMPEDASSLIWLKKHWKISIDLKRGIVVHNNDLQKPWRENFDILENGGYSWDALLIDKNHGKFLRVRDWKEQQHITFVLIDVSQIITGVCLPTFSK